MQMIPMAEDIIKAVVVVLVLLLIGFAIGKFI